MGWCFALYRNHPIEGHDRLYSFQAPKFLLPSSTRCTEPWRNSGRSQRRSLFLKYCDDLQFRRAIEKTAQQGRGLEQIFKGRFFRSKQEFIQSEKRRPGDCRSLPTTDQERCCMLELPLSLTGACIRKKRGTQGGTDQKRFVTDRSPPGSISTCTVSSTSRMSEWSIRWAWQFPKSDWKSD